MVSVTEGSFGPSTGGRPPRQLAFCAEQGTSSSPIWVRRASMLRSPASMAGSSAHHDEPARIETARSAVSSGRRPVRVPPVARPQDIPGGCGESASAYPGPWSSSRVARSRRRSCRAGTVTRSANASASTIGAPVWVDNDVNVLALGEWRSGVAAGHDNVVVIKIGTGIGAGIISDGRLHRGAQEAPATWGTSRSPTTRRSSAAAGTSGASRHYRGGGARAGGRGRGARRPQRQAAGCPRSARQPVGRGRGAGRVVRRPGGGRSAASRRPEHRLHAGKRRELLQPVADRLGGGVANSPRSADGIDLREHLPPLSAARDAGPAPSSDLRSELSPASSARRRWSSTNCSRGRRSPAGSRPATPLPCRICHWRARLGRPPGNIWHDHTR